MSERGSGIGDRGSVFERAIDGAVREMLDVEPPAGLRARVLRRIHPDHQAASGQQAACGFSRKILWLGVPLAAAAVIVLAVVLPSRAPQQHVQPTKTTVATVEPPRAPVTPARPVDVPARTASAPRPTPITSSPRIAVPERTIAAASFEAASTINVEPLASITPIEIEPIPGYQVTLSEISVRPLTPIAELQIAPLRPLERD